MDSFLSKQPEPRRHESKNNLILPAGLFFFFSDFDGGHQILPITISYLIRAMFSVRWVSVWTCWCGAKAQMQRLITLRLDVSPLISHQQSGTLSHSSNCRKLANAHKHTHTSTRFVTCSQDALCRAEQIAWLTNPLTILQLHMYIMLIVDDLKENTETGRFIFLEMDCTEFGHF